MKTTIAILILLAVFCFALPAQTVRTVSITTSIADGASTTPPIALGACLPVAIVIPAGWTSSSVAFEASVNGTTFYTVNQYGARRIEAVAVGWNDIMAADSWAWRHFKILKVNSSGVAVNQSGAVAPIVVCR